MRFNILFYSLAISLLLCGSLVKYANAGVYREGCINGYLGFSKAPDQKTQDNIRILCDCQEKELSDKGVSQTELSNFVKAAANAKNPQEVMKASPTVYGLLVSEAMAKKCANPFTR